MPERAPVSVVVPTYDSEATIRRTLRAVVPQAAEVLVVDDGSRDATPRIAEEEGATLVTVRGRSAGHARNVGWAQARHDLVLFTDSDAVPAPGWCAALARAFDDQAVEIAGGPIGSLSTTPFSRVYHRMYTALDAANFHDGSVYLPGMNLAVRKSLRERVCFRDELPGAQCEDVDFLLRAAKAGVRTRFVPDALVLHEQPADLDALVEQELRHGMGRARLVRLHPELARPWHTDAWWKWILMSTAGAPIHVLDALLRMRRADAAVVLLHVLRMGIGDRGYLEGARALRAEAASRAAKGPAPPTAP